MSGIEKARSLEALAGLGRFRRLRPGSLTTLPARRPTGAADPKATVVFLESRRCILQKRTFVDSPRLSSAACGGRRSSSVGGVPSYHRCSRHLVQDEACTLHLSEIYGEVLATVPRFRQASMCARSRVGRSVIGREVCLNEPQLFVHRSRDLREDICGVGITELSCRIDASARSCRNAQG